MPLTDSKGQGIPYPVLTDRPNARTFGENLVEAVAGKTVMRFPSRSVRGATLTNPTQGMVTWVDDEKLLEVYDGDEWAAVAAGRTTWQTIPLASGFSAPNDSGNNHQGTPQWRFVYMFGEPTIMLRGGIRITYSGGNVPNGGKFTSAPLPASYWPTTEIRTVTVSCSTVGSNTHTMKLDAYGARQSPNAADSGHLKLVGFSEGHPPWVSLNGVFYSL